ncbi:hypothetical protein FRB97_002089, partial [Tulasnella sp. 331]
MWLKVVAGCGKSSITGTIEQRVKALINEPLLTLSSQSPEILIGVDRVDECEEEYASKLLELIGRDHVSLPQGVKFLITSQAERRIRSKLESPLAILEHLILDNEDPVDVEMDIVLYLKDGQPRVAEQYDIDE